MGNVYFESVLYACQNLKHVKARNNNSHFQQNKTTEIVQNNRKQRKWKEVLAQFEKECYINTIRNTQESTLKRNKSTQNKKAHKKEVKNKPSNKRR